MATTGTMTCADARSRIDGFVDGELLPAESIHVARHLSQCQPCDMAAQDLLAIRDALVREADRAVVGLDLSGVWAHVDRTITHAAAQQAWRERVAARRLPVQRAVAWGTLAAIAAGAVLFLRPVGDTRPVQMAKGGAALTRASAKRLPNHVYIDRLAGKDIALRREPKSGTTMIWVNHEVERSGW